MKKILLTIAALSLFVSANAAVFSTNLVKGVQTCLTNRAQIYNVMLIATNSQATVRLFDAPGTAYTLTNYSFAWGTNILNFAYTARVSYPTTMVSYTVTPYGSNLSSVPTGVNQNTNWYTNIGIFTTTATVAKATNNASPIGVFVVPANSSISYNVDATCELGIVADLVETNNVGIVISYRP